MTAKKEITLSGLKLGAVWLDEAALEACADLGFTITRVKITAEDFAERAASGDWTIKAKDGSFQPARRYVCRPGGDQDGPSR